MTVRRIPVDSDLLQKVMDKFGYKIAAEAVRDCLRRRLEARE